jgi:hypothetical protein
LIFSGCVDTCRACRTSPFSSRSETVRALPALT